MTAQLAAGWQITDLGSAGLELWRGPRSTGVGGAHGAPYAVAYPALVAGDQRQRDLGPWRVITHPSAWPEPVADRHCAETHLRKLAGLTAAPT